MILSAEWEATYKPIKNDRNEWGMDYSAFETYGEDQDFVMEQPNENVWTEVDVDGGVYIVAGKHFVNRIQYFVCEVPWTNENEEVVISLGIDCADCGCTGGFGTNDDGSDCHTCSNDDYVAYPETKEELMELLGDKVNE